MFVFESARKAISTTVNVRSNSFASALATCSTMATLMFAIVMAPKKSSKCSSTNSSFSEKALVLEIFEQPQKIIGGNYSFMPIVFTKCPLSWQGY